MVCDTDRNNTTEEIVLVLILILLEYGLRHCIIYIIVVHIEVLILILLEYGLRQVEKNASIAYQDVLILILLEYGLRRGKICVLHSVGGGLNPYSIGIWSATPKIANH